jgi:hypothetical protein
MTIEIHNPELEQLLQQRIKAGNFANVEEMLLDTLRREEEHTATAEELPAQSLYALLAPVRGLLTDEEIDRCFSRNPSTGRPVDLG